MCGASSRLLTAGVVVLGVERDPRDAGAVVVGQEPPAGVRVPPHSPVGRETRCAADFGAFPAGEPGIWTVGVGRRAGPAAAVGVMIRFTRR